MREEFCQYLSTLSRCALFRGIPTERLSDMLDRVDARVVEFNRGETIYRYGDTVSDAAIVLEGAVMVEDVDMDGGSVNILLREEGDELGAILVVSGKRRSFMRVYAAARSRLLLFDLHTLLSIETRSEEQWRLTGNLLAVFSERCLELYQKTRIYGKKRIRSRIRIYLMSLEVTDGAVVLPMNRTELAAWLGVDRAALARELGRMQADGLIALDKRRIRLLDREYFQLGDE